MRHHRNISSQITIILFILLVETYNGFSQDSIPIQENFLSRFQTLSTEDGLTHNQILDIVMDNNNYVWIATLEGLNRYDGQRIKSYPHIPDNPNSLPIGPVTCLDVDNSGMLWVGTENGLFTYVEKTDNFMRIKFPYKGINVTNIRAIMNDGDSLLWIEVINGHLLKYNKKDDKIIDSWRHHDTIWQPYYYYHDIFKDKRGKIWIGGRMFYPTYIDEVTNKLVIIPTGNKPGQNKLDDVSCYFEDSDNNFWISGLNGVYNYNTSTGLFSPFLPVNTFTIIENDNYNLWFGSKNGIYIYDKSAKKLHHHLADINNPASLPNNHVNKLYKDRQGNIWIGTDNGLAIYRASNEFLNYFNHVPENSLTPSSNFVTTSLVDKSGNIWIGYQDHGIDLYNPSSGYIKHYRASKAKKSSLPSDKISCLYEDSHGDLYIGLWEGIGFARKKRDSETFEFFTYDHTSVNKDWYNDFAEDRLGNFYIGFWGADGLTLFDRQKAVFGSTLKDKFEDSYDSRLVTKLLTDSKNRIWMGTTKSGLYVYDPVTETSRRFYYQPELKTSFVGLTITDIIEDGKGRICIAADSLFIFDPASDLFTVWGKEKGLSCNHVYKILIDDVGNLWLGTDNGIICFNLEWDYCLSFPDLAGIEMTEELSTASKLKDGRLLFGGKTGWIIFNPEIVINNQELPDIFLTDLSVKGELKIPNLSMVNQIELMYYENFFSVGFSNTDLTAISRYSYRFRLNNLEDNWTYINKGNLAARYTNIQPGRYVLEIQLALNNSNWKNIKMRSIIVDIKPPLWKRTWFVITIMFLALVIVSIAIRDFYKRMLSKRKMAELKELLLRAQINPHFIFNALVAIQGYIYKKEEKKAGKYLAEFAKLIRLTLENTKEEFITLEKEIQLLEYYLSLQKQRFKTKFDYEIKIDQDIDLNIVKIPPMLAQPFVENAIEHGVTKRISNGFILISFMLKENSIVYTIEDNGIGRSKSFELKIGLESHKSFGTEITEERLNFFKNSYHLDIDYNIKDLMDENNQAMGTLVTFKIPQTIK